MVRLNPCSDQSKSSLSTPTSHPVVPHLSLPLNAQVVPQGGVSMRIRLQTAPHRTFNRAIEMGAPGNMNSSGSYLLELCLKIANSQLLNDPMYFRRQMATGALP